jgi:hypothetical protein
VAARWVQTPARGLLWASAWKTVTVLPVAAEGIDASQESSVLEYCRVKDAFPLVLVLANSVWSAFLSASLTHIDTVKLFPVLSGSPVSA